jgi:hypothetical protein
MAVALLAISCGMQRVSPPPPEESETPSGPLFDPLETPQDREVVPEVYPVRVTAVPDAGDSLVSPGDLSYLQFDSASSVTAPTEVYRVQIFTSRLYSEAVRERQLADEIFNLPISLDYEVPYYKLRVGDFATRGEAEDLIPEIKTIGYRNAWVARVVLRIREAPEDELLDEPILPDASDTLLTPQDSVNEGDDL